MQINCKEIQNNYRNRQNNNRHTTAKTGTISLKKIHNNNKKTK